MSRLYLDTPEAAPSIYLYGARLGYWWVLGAVNVLWLLT